MSNSMSRFVMSAVAGAALFLAGAGHSQAQVLDLSRVQVIDQLQADDILEPSDDQRLMIVNTNTGQVIYNNGIPDLFCATGLVVVGHTHQGRRIVRRTMICR
jgi:hypothetical protein